MLKTLRANPRIFHLCGLCSLMLSLLLAFYIYRSGGDLRIDGATKGLLSLQLAPTPDHARAILTAWSEADVVALAQKQILWDYLLIVLYMCGLFWATRLAEFVFDPPMKELVHHFAWAPVAAGILDFFFENSMSLFMLENPTNTPNIWVFVFLAVPAALKWLLLVATSALLLSALIIFLLTPIRSRWAISNSAFNVCPQHASPAEVLHQELDLLQLGRPNDIRPREIITSNNRATTRACNSNLFGLALSGGGIRSATFSLGVLQALARRKILSRFDYLSTVSGGGYIGAWLSAWISRERDGIEKVQEQLQNKDKSTANRVFTRVQASSNGICG